MKNEKLYTKIPAVLFCFFIMGFCDIVGISSDYAQETFGWSHTMTGFIPFMTFIWFFFLSIPIGIQMNKWGRKNTVLLSMAITVVGMFIPMIDYNGITCMVAYALMGMGNAVLQVSLNPLLGNVIINRKLLTSSLTIGQVIKAVSSFTGPYIVLFAVNILGKGNIHYWYYTFPIMGIITLLSGLWLYITPIPVEKQDSMPWKTSVGDTLSLLKDKRIFLLFLGIFFAVGIDVSTNFISSKIMITRFDWTKEQAGTAPQIYFISRTVGALLGAYLMTHISEIKYFKGNIIACLITLFILAFNEIELLNLICIGGIGFLASCIFPIIYSMAVQARPEKANQISGLMITAVAGGGVVTPLLGVALDVWNILGGLMVIVICACYLIYCAFGLK